VIRWAVYVPSSSLGLEFVGFYLAPNKIKIKLLHTLSHSDDSYGPIDERTTVPLVKAQILHDSVSVCKASHPRKAILESMPKICLITLFLSKDLKKTTKKPYQQIISSRFQQVFLKQV
jgi:hypothetical protein